MAARKKSVDLQSAISGLQDAIHRQVKFSSAENEALVKLAIDIINTDYWDDVRGVTDDLLKEIKDGDITSREQLDERVSEAIDGTQRVIYTFQAKLGLLATNNADGYEEELGDKPPTIEAQMAWAMRMDVFAQLDAYDEVQNLE